MLRVLSGLTWLSLLAMEALAGVRPEHVRGIRQMAKGEVEISIVVEIPRPKSGRTVVMNGNVLNNSAAKFACGSDKWARVAESKWRMASAKSEWSWKLTVRCDVSEPSSQMIISPDRVELWSYSMHLEHDAKRVRAKGMAIAEIYGRRRSVPMYDRRKRLYRALLSIIGTDVRAQIEFGDANAPQILKMRGLLERTGRKQCDWRVQLLDDAGNRIDLQQPGGACAKQ